MKRHGIIIVMIASLSFAAFAGVRMELLSNPTFCDLNRDNQIDLIVGDNDGGVHYFHRMPETGIHAENRQTLPIRVSVCFQILAIHSIR